MVLIPSPCLSIHPNPFSFFGQNQNLEDLIWPQPLLSLICGGPRDWQKGQPTYNKAWLVTISNSYINQVKSIKLWEWWNSWFPKYLWSIYTFTQRYANYFLNQNIGLSKYTSPSGAQPACCKKHNLALIIIHIFIWFPKWVLISTLI